MSSEQQGSTLASHQLATDNVTNALSKKLAYLEKVQKAIAAQDDRLVYELIDSKRYHKEVLRQPLKEEEFKDSVKNEHLINDINYEISEFLSEKLIAYLREVYPFFYFVRKAAGQYQFYFGNWWGRRLFGELDVLNVSFKFKPEEFEKLKQSFALEKEGKRYNSQAIQDLALENERLQDMIDNGDSRDKRKQEIRDELKELAQVKVMPWESGKHREAKQELVDELAELTEIDENMSTAYHKIKENEQEILDLSKEDTLLGYEKQSILAKFNNFSNFNAKTKDLYRDYIAHLIALKGRVKAHDEN